MRKTASQHHFVVVSAFGPVLLQTANNPQPHLIPRPTLFFIIRFARKWKSSKKKTQNHGRPGRTHHVSEHRWIWGGGNRKLKNMHRVKLSIASRVWTSGEVLQLDDELIVNLLNLPPTMSTFHPLDVIHMIKQTKPSPFLTHTSASVYYCRQKTQENNGEGLGTRL